MSVSRNMSELMSEAKALSLDSKITPTARGGKISKDDVCRELRKHFLARDYPSGMPYKQILKPMLCERFEEIEVRYPETAIEIFKDNSGWALNQKFNGCRMNLYFTKTGVYADSRNISVKTYRNEEYSDQLVFQNHIAPFTCTLDCEVESEKIQINTSVLGRQGTITESVLQATTAILALDTEASLEVQRTQSKLLFKVFDIIEFNGKDLSNLPLKERVSLLNSFVMPELMKSIETLIPAEWVVVGKREFYQNLLKAGHEGCVAKRWDSPYIQSDSRSHRHWIKIKRTLEVDAFVCGWTKATVDSGWDNLIGGLQMGLYLLDENGERVSETPHIIATITNITMAERDAISKYDAEGNLFLDPSWMGRVAEVVGQAVSARKRALSHARVLRWRDSGADAKAADDCSFPLDLLAANIL